jgi:hypothetical protein
MKLLARQDGRLRFQLRAQEAAALRWLAGQYPLHDRAGQSLAGPGGRPPCPEADDLLRQALAEQQAERRAWLRTLPGGEAGAKAPRLLELDPEQAEWLLQAMNDLRVGAWRRLGCPDEQAERRLGTPEQLQWLAVMELAAAFELAVLTGLHAEEDPPAPPAGEG